MSQFMEALVKVDLYKQKQLLWSKGEKKDMGLFGWCLDGNHELCFVKIPEHSCKCDCHGEAAND
jgi:hypothetical protein